MNRLHLGLAALFLTGSTGALAQSGAPLEQRVDRVEKELRAVQRKVFPGGNPGYSEPEIAAPPVQQAPIGQGSATPLNELAARIDALERENERLTGQVEQDQHRLGIVSEQAARDRREFDARLKALEASAPPPLVAGDDVAPPPVRQSAPLRRGKPAPPPKAAPAAEEAPPSAASPSTGDPAEDGYMAGYSLWMEKKYPDAEAALKKVVAKYPKHRRASYAQNLLGRAYLDDGQPATAAEAFAANYQRDPKGERAPDSLYYLGQSLVALKKPADACRVYDEMDSAYGATLSASLKTRETTARKEAKCK